jgi:hypothetical protein
MNAHQRRIERRRIERLPLMRGELGTILGVTFITTKEQMVEAYGQPRDVLPSEANALFEALYPLAHLEVTRSKKDFPEA